MAGETPAGGSSGSVGPVRRALTSRWAPRLRTGVAVFLVVAASLGVLASAVALWARDVVSDGAAYVRIVAPVERDPEVRAAVARYAAAEAVRAARLGERFDAALPSGARLAAPALTQVVQQYLAAEIEKFLATGLAQRVWARVNRDAHEQLVSALRNEDRSAGAGSTEVRLELLPLVVVALQQREADIPDIFGQDVTLPPLDPETPPGDTRTLLQDALGRVLPAHLASITLLHGDGDYTTERALRVLGDAAALVVSVTLALAAAALLVSVRRWWTALWLGAGALLAFAAARVFEAQVQRAAVAAVQSEDGAAVARAVLTAALSSLNGYVAWVAVAGSVVCVAALLAGRPAWLAAIGQGVARLFGVASGLSAPDTRAGRWFGAHLDLLRVAGVAVAVVALPFLGGSIAGVVAVVVALVVFELVLTVYDLGKPAV